MDIIHTVSIDIQYDHAPNIKIKYDCAIDYKIINEDEYNNLLSYKNKIEELEDTKSWDKAKKLSNEYELIHLPNKKVKSESISLYEPLSRSYFKMWEILHEFPLNNIDKTIPINITSIAEGPGGFIEALINYRLKYYNIKDNIYGITLKSTNKDIPGWKKAHHF